MTTVERPIVLERVHDILVVLLIALRPLCWDGMPGQAADIVWQAMAGVALLIVAAERAANLRPTWLWSWRGMTALALVLALMPAVLAAPEPAPSWCRWSGWVACLCAAGYLAQVLAGRLRLAIGALAAGLTMTVILGLAQPLIVFPAMAAAQQAGAAMFEALPGGADAIAERIANGGAYATFTLANQFGAYLALLIPLIVGLAWTSRTQARWPAAILLTAALGALACTDAKGAWLALAAGAMVGWWVAFPGRWHRWLPLVVGGLGCLAVISSGLSHASVAVRLGYWRSASAIIQESPWRGHGLDAFAVHQSRVMQIGDEPTRLVHNEVLEAAVAGGWGLALLMVAALVAWAWPRRASTLPLPAERSPGNLIWVVVPLVLYLALLRALDGNLAWWPGGDSLAGILLWSLLLGLAGALIGRAVATMEPPPAWAYAAGLAAVAFKALIDFDLHAGGLVGTALVVAVCAGAPRAASGLWSRWLPGVAALGALGVIGFGAATGLRLAEADSLLAAARQLRHPEMRAELTDRLGLPPETPPREVAGEAGMRIWTLGAGAPVIRLGALELLPPSAEVLTMSAALVEAAPASAAVRLHHAERLAANTSWSEAVTAAERAVQLSPTSPGILRDAARILQRAAARLPARSVELQARAQELEATSARNLPLVHPGMRGGF